MGYKDGTKILIDKKCVCATSKPFQKPTKDVENKVETRPMIKKKKKSNLEYMYNYYNKLQS